MFSERRLEMTYKLLIVEDDKSLREIMTDYFTDSVKEEKFEVTEAEDGNIAMDYLETEEFDLVFLDIMLPGLNGFDICRKIRRTSEVPVIFLTARTMEEDVLLGFETGCDDYITKPFSLKTLYAKSLALLNRARGTVLDENLTVGNISVNVKSMEVTSCGQAVSLSPKEYELLLYFMQHKNRVLTREIILNAVWGFDYEGTDRVVDNHVKKLRKDLGSAGAQIKTMISKGYKMTE